MDIPSLQAFLAIVSRGSFSLAAEDLALTQPAVSKRLGTLERHLGVRLFNRIGRQVSLTEAGEALLPRARRLLAELEDTQRAIANLSGRVAGRLLVGTSHQMGLHRRPPVLRQCTEEGLLILMAGGNVLRFAPALNSSEEQLRDAVDILGKALAATRG